MPPVTHNEQRREVTRDSRESRVGGRGESLDGPSFEREHRIKSTGITTLRFEEGNLFIVSWIKSFR